MLMVNFFLVNFVFSLIHLKFFYVDLCYNHGFGLFSAVGLGSWCFHMTLKYEMQVSSAK